MDLHINRKTAIVGASSKGLGRACAEALAAEGVRVAICARHEERLRQTREEITAAIPEAELIAIQADLSKPEDIRRLIDTTAEAFGPVDILVTNAGGPPAGYFEDFDDEQWLRSHELTLMSAVRLIRGVLPYMKKSGWGRIINITSLSVKEPVDNLILSNSIRASVHGMAKTLSNQFAPFGITVNNVMPGYTRTDRVEELVQAQMKQTGKSKDDVLAEMGKPIPAGRVGQPFELASLVAYLSSQQAGYITGVSIPVDGGRIRAAF